MVAWLLTLWLIFLSLWVVVLDFQGLMLRKEVIYCRNSIAIDLRPSAVGVGLYCRSLCTCASKETDMNGQHTTKESLIFPNKGPVYCPSDFRRARLCLVGVDVTNAPSLVSMGGIGPLRWWLWEEGCQIAIVSGRNNPIVGICGRKNAPSLVSVA